MGGVTVGSLLAESGREIRIPLLGFYQARAAFEQVRRVFRTQIDFGGVSACLGVFEQQRVHVAPAVRKRRLDVGSESQYVEYLVDCSVERKKATVLNL
uniref:hypothetical protein n=1 Tax=Halobiforma nitratireducens TaxID=130048 RepID=UPI001EF9F01C|nr:hypothetical protein [Halobiforma nitratireducens]